MDYRTDIIEIMEQMPKDTARIALKMGKRRDRIHHMTNIFSPFTDGQLIDTLEENGFGTSHQFGRLIFYSADKKQLSSKNIEQYIDSDDEPKTDMNIMVEGVLASMQEMRRFVSVINDTIVQREHTLTNVMERLMFAKEESMIEKQAALSMEMELDFAKETAEQSYKSQAINAVAHAANTFAETYAKKIDPQLLIKTIKENPELIELALEDPELTKLISQKIFESAVLQKKVDS